MRGAVGGRVDVRERVRQKRKKQQKKTKKNASMQERAKSSTHALVPCGKFEQSRIFFGNSNLGEKFDLNKVILWDSVND